MGHPRRRTAPVSVAVMAEGAGTGGGADQDAADRDACRATANRPPSAIRIDLHVTC
jgi:hypothetical protein